MPDVSARGRLRNTCALMAVAVLIAGCQTLPEAGVQSNAASAFAGADFPAYGGDHGGTRFSTLDQINKANVAGLTQAWRFDMPVGASQHQPIIIDGVLYAATTDSKLVALDGATGQTRWSVALDGIGPGRRRGLTYWENGADRRLLVPDGRIVYQVNADNGQLITSFGDGGKIDLGLHLRGDDPTKNLVNMGSPASLYKDIFITHGGVPESSPSAPGDIRGWDIRTGKLLWTFRTIPHPGEEGYETWPADYYKTGGGVNAWQGVIVDEKNGIVFAALGSAADDFWGGERPGDNLYGNSLVALDATTGKKLWHYQTIRHDMWDYDFSAQPILMTVQHNGRMVEAVAASNKTGFVFIFDRKTGESLFPIDERPIPPSNVPGEVAAKSQPVPRLPAPMGLHEVTPDSLTNRTPEANAWARAELAKLTTGPVFTPINKDGLTLVLPGFSGGVEWGGMAADPSGVLYGNSENIGWVMGLRPNPNPGPGRSAMAHTGFRKFVDPDGYPATAPPWGTLNAIDMNTGQYRWRIPFGYYPELAEKGMKDTGSESYGGPVVTASGLLFIGATIYDRKMRAFDTNDGRLLWEADLPYSGVATPATYMAGGKQYVAIIASGGRDRNGPTGAALVAFALPN